MAEAMLHKKKYRYRCDDGHEFEAEQFIDARSTTITRCRVSCCDAPCYGEKVMTTYEGRYEEGRRQHATASSGSRRYDICMALNMTKLSIELERLERLGVDPEVTARWKDRGRHLLTDILQVSDPLKSRE